MGLPHVFEELLDDLCGLWGAFLDAGEDLREYGEPLGSFQFLQSRQHRRVDQLVLVELKPVDDHQQ